MIGRTVSHYRILEQLGEGGMGVVYRAEDTALQRTVALKFLPPELTRDADAKQRFLHEARAAARLDHPNICAVYEVGESDGQLFLAMACYEGQTLRERLKAGPLPWAEAAGLALQAAAGLSEAHARGIVHRDIKPANLFLTNKGQVKILDFGLAKLSGASVLTQSGSTLGTAAYMAPEQVQGENADARSDLWSLGVVLHELITGSPPFRGEYAQAIMYGILNEAPVPLAELGIDAPPGLQEVVSRCLAKQPEDRYATAEELGRALAECLGPERSAAALAALRPARVRRRWPALAIAAVVVVMVSFGLVAWRNGWWPFPAQAPLIRLAVLPLANLSGDPEQEYLSDGLTQELINQLGRLHPATLSVIARTSIMRYKKSDKGVDQIGKELGVDYILEGSAVREGGRVRVTAELIRVGDQSQLWADAFEREMAGVLALQSDVAKKVSGALALKLLPAEQARLANIRSVNPEAHEAHLKGFQFLYKISPADFDTAERYFNLALAKDPNYAPAFEGLALVWVARSQYGITLPEVAGSKAKEAARRAIELDDDAAEAHAALAMVKTVVDWDWAGAESEWRRALAINPNAAVTHSFYAVFLSVVLGRLDEALYHNRRAIELDPFNVRFHSTYASTLYHSRRYDEAIAAADRALSLQPDDAGAEGARQVSWIAKGARAELLAQQRKRIAKDPGRMAAFQKGLAEGGYEGAQRRLGDLLAARYRQTSGVPAFIDQRVYMPTNIALRYMDARDYERALDWLEEGYRVRDPLVIDLAKPLYDPIRSNPRFQALVRKLNLPWALKK